MVFHDSSETRAIYDNVEKIWYSQTRPMRFVCWITKATKTHSEYAIFLLLHEKCASEVPHCYVYTKIAYPVIDMNVYEDFYAKKFM
jgi:hypothetical protein